jgi:hypothetical protein
LRLLASEPLPLGTSVRLLRLSRGLGFPGLLQAPLGLGKLSCLGGGLLRSTAEVLTRTRSLSARLLELAAHIRQLPRPCKNRLLAAGNLLTKGRQPLLCLRQLLLEISQALALCFHIASNLTGSLFGSLKGLLCRGQLSLGLLTGLCDLRQLLLCCLKGLLEGCHLRLKLVTRLRSLGSLLLCTPGLGLQLTLLAANLRLQLALLLLKSGLLRCEPVSARRQRSNAFLELALLLRQPLPLRAEVGKLRLCCSLRLTDLLQAALSL